MFCHASAKIKIENETTEQGIFFDFRLKLLKSEIPEVHFPSFLARATVRRRKPPTRFWLFCDLSFRRLWVCRNDSINSILFCMFTYNYPGQKWNYKSSSFVECDGFHRTPVEAFRILHRRQRKEISKFSWDFKGAATNQTMDRSCKSVHASFV